VSDAIDATESYTKALIAPYVAALAAERAKVAELEARLGEYIACTDAGIEHHRRCAVETERDALRARLEAAEKLQVWGFYEDEVPSFQQGPGRHELQEVVTVEDVTRWITQLEASERDARELREALEVCAESLAAARDKLGMTGEGDGKDRKADAFDSIGSLPALLMARAALAAEESK
jgi:predicted SPOUT superfamily RNA methylase MTH1